MAKERTKKQYPENFRSLAGFSGVIFFIALGTTIMGVFMLYLTNFASIDSFIGKAGFAAAFTSAFLLITRIIDAIDDPLQGWIMDSSKEI